MTGPYARIRRPGPIGRSTGRSGRLPATWARSARSTGRSRSGPYRATKRYAFSALAEEGAGRVVPLPRHGLQLGDGLGERDVHDRVAAQGRHAPEQALLDELGSLEPEAGREHAVAGCRRASSLHVAEHRDARLVPRSFLDLASERLADAAQADVAELVDALASVNGLALAGRVRELRTLAHDDDREVLPLAWRCRISSHASSNPGKITLASFGTGTTSHLVGEWFGMMAGVKMVHVPYRGSGPLVTDLLGGQVQCAFDNLPGSIEQIRAGKLRALAVSTATRSESLPEIPTVGEFLPTFEAKAWVAIGVPKNTPVQIIDTLNAEINAGLANSKMKARIAELGATVFPGSPADFSKLVADDTEKWAKVIRFAGLKPD